MTRSNRTRPTKTDTHKPIAPHVERMDKGERISLPYCEETGKVAYTSKHQALSTLTGGLKSKAMRVYQCPHHKGHFHMTKEAIGLRKGKKRLHD